MTSSTPEVKKCAECNHIHQSDGSCIGNRNLCRCTARPEPELDVEAEMDSIMEDLIVVHNFEHARKEMLALIQQVSDQRVREFAEELEKHVWDIDLWQLSGLKVVSAGTIQRTLADYLSHLEQSHE